MIVIVDYDMGNVGSIFNMLKKIGVPASITADHDQIRAATKLILPGVGAFDSGMTNLERSGLRAVIEEQVLERGVPVLGVCLGMELLMEGSEEGASSGLGWIRGRNIRFRFPDGVGQLNVPHMGWNSVRPVAGSRLLAAMERDARFYFVHSFHVLCDDTSDVAGWTQYGYEFASVIERGHVMGTQFHPEKSHRFGLALLRTFAGV